MKRKILTLAAAVVAIGGAFAGSSNAKKLVVQQGWYRSPMPAENAIPEATSTLSARAQCEDNTLETCLYHFEANATEWDTTINGTFN
ncbi:DUF6520 family protein [Sphingobacterium bambusae]|uniref:DUF6520 family protein n=1 Tax=Sphingobacterium bambusae TaxID=662858 RepID=A0ABW6B9J0_9SPHI|nr:DUF6520 family protein [Sphingobacterium bambusae]WPL48476.1 DUF6520 family protein [Sphingobacterium bambusae]